MNLINRTAERVLSIIAASLMFVGIIFSFIGAGFFSLLNSDPGFRMEMETILYEDPTVTAEAVEFVFDLFDFLSGLIWFFIIVFIIAFILAIIGIINVWNNKNPKAAGIFFIVAGVLSGILSISSILLYIAGILCFTKKTPLEDEYYSSDDTYGNDSMRPL